VASFIRTPEELTAEWLAAALDRPAVDLIRIERIGTGQMSQNHRVTFSEADGEPETVVMKLASDDSTSRATGVGMRAYYREVTFYRELAPRLGDALPVCLVAEYDDAEGWFTLVLEDVVGARQGDQIAGCAVEDARIALRALARLHAPVLGDPAVGAAAWLNEPSPLTQALLTHLLPGFLERYGDRITPDHAEVCKRFVAVVDAWSADRRPPLGLVHGDYRLDNLLFGDGSCKVVDWQTVSWGPAMGDATYFISGGLGVEDRRASEEELVRLYHDELLAQGVEEFAWEDCWDGYRRQAFHGILMTIAASMVVARTERGDDMFMTWLERNAQQILDLDALAVLPEPGTGRPAPLRPAPADEGRHAPGAESTWNESWYFDAVSEAHDLGVYVRIGRVPNRGVALYTAAVCGPDRPAILVLDAAAPLPAADDDAQAIEVDGLQAEHQCEQPLERFRVTLRGTGEAHEDESAPLRSEAGTPVDVELDLVWETDGIPYAWRQASRYEIPCRVSGVVRIGDEEISMSGPGQRDHSWGARDWWAVDWMWNAFHLDDGTHTHAVGIPQMPGYGVGYIQKGGELLEIESVHATEEVAANGLIASARIASGPDELVTDIEPLAFGALRLEAPDGRVTHFPRAMCRVRTADGRTGAGWIEWNRNQRQ
jgi:hypothetical protein